MKKIRKQPKAERLVALESIVPLYEGALLRYVTRLVCDRDTAQDVVQDAFIKLLKKWEGELLPDSHVSSWLYRVAHNRAVDHIRKEVRRRQLHLRHAKRRDRFVAPDRGKGSRLSEAAERAAVVLQSLSLRERQLVVLKVYEEKSYKEIGEITGLTTGNVGYILHHAMKKMARDIQRMRDNE